MTMLKTAIGCDASLHHSARNLFRENFDQFEVYVFQHCTIHFGHSNQGVPNMVVMNECPITNDQVKCDDHNTVCQTAISTLESSPCSVCKMSDIGCYGIGVPNPAFFSMSILMTHKDTQTQNSAFLLQEQLDEMCSLGSLYDRSLRRCIPHPCLSGYSFMNHTCFRYY